jgi:hypothetical protein
MNEDAADLLNRISPEQLRFVAARVRHNTDKAAAEAVGLHPSTVYKWDCKSDLDRLVNMMLREPLKTAVARLETMAGDAVDALADLLQSEDEKIRLDAAKTYFNLVGVGKPDTEVNVDVRQTFDLDQWKKTTQARLDAIAELPEIDMSVSP